MPVGLRWPSATVPVIVSQPSTSEVAPDEWQVSWSVSAPATGQVFYDTVSYAGQLGSYAFSSTLEPSLLTFHSQTLSSLSPSTTYYAVVVSTVDGNSATSSEFTFTTAAVAATTSMYQTDVYGSGAHADAKQDQRIGGLNTVQVGWRFISHGGTIVGFTPQKRTGSGYSLGDGGILSGELWSVDGGTGMPDTLLATCFSGYVPGNTGADAFYPFIPFTVTPTLTTGTDYIFVIKNTHASQTTNYVAVNNLTQYSTAYPPGLDGRHFAAFTDDCAVLFKTSGVWARTNLLPCFDIRYSDGTSDGSGYIASFPATAQTGIISGSTNMARERITASRTIAIRAIYARVGRSSGATGNVVLGLYSGWTGNTLIDSVTADGSALQVYTLGANADHGDWIGGNLSATRTIVLGDQFHVRISKSGGTGEFYVVPLLSGPGAPGASEMRSRSFTDGMAQRTTNGGSSWSDLYSGSRTNLELYMVLA